MSTMDTSCVRSTYQLSTAQTKLNVLVASLFILFLSLSMTPSATSFIKLTSSSSRLRWLLRDAFVCPFLTASNSRRSISRVGVAGAMAVAGADGRIISMA